MKEDESCSEITIVMKNKNQIYAGIGYSWVEFVNILLMMLNPNLSWGLATKVLEIHGNEQSISALATIKNSLWWLTEIGNLGVGLISFISCL